MALKKTVTINSGLVAVDAYIRIDNIGGTKQRQTITVGIYASATCDHPPAEIRVYEFEPSVTDGALNFIRQGYDYLKNRAEYANAEDC